MLKKGEGGEEGWGMGGFWYQKQRPKCLFILNQQEETCTPLPIPLSSPPIYPFGPTSTVYMQHGCTHLMQCQDAQNDNPNFTQRRSVRHGQCHPTCASAESGKEGTPNIILRPLRKNNQHAREKKKRRSKRGHRNQRPHDQEFETYMSPSRGGDQATRRGRPTGIRSS